LTCNFFFQAEDGIRDRNVTGVQTCALPIFTVDPPAGDTLVPLTPHDRLERWTCSRRTACAGGLHRPGVLLGHGDPVAGDTPGVRSEERRVGKECRCAWWQER